MEEALKRILQLAFQQNTCSGLPQVMQPPHLPASLGRKRSHSKVKRALSATAKRNKTDKKGDSSSSREKADKTNSGQGCSCPQSITGFRYCDAVNFQHY